MKLQSGNWNCPLNQPNWTQEPPRMRLMKERVKAVQEDMSEGQNQFNRQDSVSYHDLERASFQFPRSKHKAFCPDMQNVFRTGS